MKVKELLKHMMKTRGCSYEKLGKDLGGLRKTSVSNMLNRQKTLSADKFCRIADLLGYDVVVRDRFNGKEIKIEWIEIEREAHSE